jgi:hypothetical protein
VPEDQDDDADHIIDGREREAQQQQYYPLEHDEDGVDSSSPTPRSA